MKFKANPAAIFATACLALAAVTSNAAQDIRFDAAAVAAPIATTPQTHAANCVSHATSRVSTVERLAAEPAAVAANAQIATATDIHHCWFECTAEYGCQYVCQHLVW